MSVEEVAQLQHETWSRRYVYEPFTEFKEPSFQGRYVNVSPQGFRTVEHQGPWPPEARNFNVFVFGGSTAFGYGVTDEQTIPSRLQQRLRPLGRAKAVCVYNFGRPFYYSTQERIFFQQLLAAGIRPDLAVFVDGLNDTAFAQDGSAFSNTLNASVKRHDPRAAGRELITKTFPMVRHARRILLPTGGLEAGGELAAEEEEVTPQWAGDETQIARRIVDRYLANAWMAAAAANHFGVKVLFVWQPVPNFRAPPSVSRFPTTQAPDQRSLMVNERMDALRANSRLPTSFLWLADTQLDRSGDLYVDAYHYSAEFSDVLAAETAHHLAALSWLP